MVGTGRPRIRQELSARYREKAGEDSEPLSFLFSFSSASDGSDAAALLAPLPATDCGTKCHQSQTPAVSVGFAHFKMNWFIVSFMLSHFELKFAVPKIFPQYFVVSCEDRKSVV